MKYLVAIILIAGLFVPARAGAQPVAISPSVIEDIAKAPDPSSTVAAYTRAKADDHDNMAVDEAYMHRMIWFGLPELTAAQARDLIARNSDDGLAWAVDGYMNAKENHVEEALASIVQAVKKSPKDLFVQRTAAQILARMNTRVEFSGVSQQTHDLIAQLPMELNLQPVFLETYQRTVDEFNHPERTATASAQESNEGLISPSIFGSIASAAGRSAPPAEQGSSNTYIINNAPVYTDPYATPGYWMPYYPAWWPNNYYSYGPSLLASSGRVRNFRPNDRFGPAGGVQNNFIQGARPIMGPPIVMRSSPFNPAFLVTAPAAPQAPLPPQVSRPGRFPMRPMVNPLRSSGLGVRPAPTMRGR